MRFRLVLKSLTLDDLEWPKRTLSQKRCVFWSPLAGHCSNLNEDRPILSAKKCRPMNLVSRNIRFMRIFMGAPLGGGVNWEWGWRRASFSDLSGYFFGIFRNKASSIIWRHATLSAGNWLQNEWPWMTLSAYLTSKSIFGQHSVAA